MKASQVGPVSETEECSGVKHVLHQVGRIPMATGSLPRQAS